jgi:arsenate reductase (thioredoxin)
MFKVISEIITSFNAENISAERKEILSGLIQYIQTKKDNGENIRLNFICTHNSRRSHFSQIWAQSIAHHFGIKNVFCYSGGTEATAMFPKVSETLANQGFEILKLSETSNPVYAVNFAENEMPVICFSKTYNHNFNPKTQFGAIMTCNSADEACPVVFGAEARFPVKYDDPKVFDNTELQSSKYTERSLEIAQEMWWCFSQIKN